uniref:Proline rich membrane anchor 1 n=1 Tax=Nothoprocta perdicaria TaxID=30464 RepID=A0A8C6YYN4_NOTPE
SKALAGTGRRSCCPEQRGGEREPWAFVLLLLMSHPMMFPLHFPGQDGSWTGPHLQAAVSIPYARLLEQQYFGGRRQEPCWGLLSSPKSTFCPTEETWWPGLVITIAVCSATLVFLFVVVIICYKAIKRKPLRKEENGTSQAEYAMTSSQNNKTVDNNAVV